MPTTCAGRPVAAASDVIGIEDVSTRTTPPGRRPRRRARRSGVSPRSPRRPPRSQVGRDDVFDRLDPRQHLGRSRRPSRAASSATLDRRQAAFDGAGAARGATPRPPRPRRPGRCRRPSGRRRRRGRVRAPRAGGYRRGVLIDVDNERLPGSRTRVTACGAVLHGGLGDSGVGGPVVERLAGLVSLHPFDSLLRPEHAAPMRPWSHTDDAIGVLDARSAFHRVAVVGLSMGGRVALDVAQRAPQPVTAVVHVAGAVGPFELRRLRRRGDARAGDAGRLAGLGAAGVGPEYVELWHADARRQGDAAGAAAPGPRSSRPEAHRPAPITVRDRAARPGPVPRAARRSCGAARRDPYSDH